MTDLLLQTKFQVPPVREKLVARPALLTQLGKVISDPDTFTYKITLISAPAGYGKTTLVTDWLVNFECKVAWLSLDEEDNDPARFLTYLIAAFGHVDVRFAELLNSMLQAPQPPPHDVMLTTLLNEINALAYPIILVLDDYQIIRTPAIHNQLNFLLEHQPNHMHQIIMTRVDPPIPLHRLRARGQMNEIRQNELRFSHDEALDFLQRLMGLNMRPDDLTALLRRTEGWATGLQLAAIAMQSTQSMYAESDLGEFVRAFTGSNRFILDYLFEEVFFNQPPETQEFLLTTSILKRLSAPLCSALTGEEGCQEVLQTLEDANLFIIPLDQSRTWYRYHRLFSDLLRHRLGLQKDTSIEELHKVAAGWFEEEGFLAEAIHHALNAEDWETSGRLIDRACDGLLKRGEIVTLLNWMGALPEDFIHSRPMLGLDYSWALILSSQYDAADATLERARRVRSRSIRVLGSNRRCTGIPGAVPGGYSTRNRAFGASAGLAAGRRPGESWKPELESGVSLLARGTDGKG